MKRKIVSILSAVLMVSTMFAGCSKGSSDNAGTTGDENKVTQAASGSSSKDLPILGAGIYSSSDNFNSYIGKAIENASKGIMATNIEDGQNDQSTQNNQVDTMLAKGAKAVALSVVDVTAAPTLIQKCKDAGNVPIIFFNKEITEFSSTGDRADIAAPGKNILSTYPKNTYITLSGTSMAAPLITGSVAIFHAKSRIRFNRLLKPDEIKLLLGMYADDLGPKGKDSKYGYGVFSFGRLNIISEAKSIASTRANLNKPAFLPTISSPGWNSFNNTLLLKLMGFRI
jgi:subtilisin family serine protease